MLFHVMIIVKEEEKMKRKDCVVDQECEKGGGCSEKSAVKKIVKSAEVWSWNAVFFYFFGFWFLFVLDGER